jgi:hypothetical protein
MQLSQHTLIIEYLKKYKTITPAIMGGNFYKNTIFGSEVGRRARELRASGVLNSFRDGRFEVFFLKNRNANKGM